MKYINKRDEVEEFGVTVMDFKLLIAVELSSSDKLVFQYLCSCRKGFNPSYKEISEALGISAKTVIICIKNLEKNNLLSVAKQKEADSNKYMKNKYSLNHSSKWKCTYSNFDVEQLV